MSKKLTLEERLSLATKANKKSKKKTNIGGASLSPSPAVIPSVEPSELKNDKPDKTNLDDKYLEIWSKLLPEDYQKIDKETLLEQWKPTLKELLAQSNHITGIEQENSEHDKTVVDNTHPTTSGTSNVNSMDDSSLMKLVRDKDSTIDKLTKELINLKKESNDELNKLKKESSNELNILQKRFDNSNKDIKKLETELTNSKGENDSLKLQIQEKDNELLQNKKKLHELQTTMHDYNIKFEDYNSLKNDLFERNSEVESLKDSVNKLELVIQNLNDKLVSQKENLLRENNTLKESNREQVTSLESKLEQLRIELEVQNLNNNTNISTSIIQNDDNNNDNFTKTENNDNIENSSIENDRILFDLKNKLTNQEEHYATLQEQFNSSKANWSSIEFALNGKLADLTNQLDEYSKNIDLITNEQSENKNLIDSLKNNLNILKDEDEQKRIKLDELQLSNEKLSRSLVDIQDDYQLLRKKYDLQKKQLTHHIDLKTPNFDKKSTFKALNHSQLENNNCDIEDNDDNSNQGKPLEGQQDIIKKFENEWKFAPESPQKPGNILNDDPLSTIEGSPVNELIEFGNSYQEESNASIMDSPLRTSRQSSLLLNNLLNENSEDEKALEALLNKRNSSTSMLNHSRISSYNLHQSPTILQQETFPAFNDNTNNNIKAPGSNNNSTNTQLVSRLGAEVRRMEGELITLQKSYDRLKSEKDSTNEELLKLVDENESVGNIKAKNNELIAKVEELELQLETSLQLLGEKTERTEELQNDVDDLKEMMQQQVQQMIEMQEKMR